MKSARSRVLECITDAPGLTGAEIAELLSDLPNTSVAAVLTKLAGQGEVMREPARTASQRATFRYTLNTDPAAKPAIKRYRPRKGKVTTIEPQRGPLPSVEVKPVSGNGSIKTMSKASLRGRVAFLEQEVADLRAWKASALERYPDLAVDPLVLKARAIVAKVLCDRGDAEGAHQVKQGQRDGMPIMIATIAALNE